MGTSLWVCNLSIQPLNDDFADAKFMRAGDTLGNIILFDPVRAEAITARTIGDPLCSIAPTADCKSFALGYVFLTKAGFWYLER